jgi:hypothetical protein
MAAALNRLHLAFVLITVTNEALELGFWVLLVCSDKSWAYLDLMYKELL